MGIRQSSYVDVVLKRVRELGEKTKKRTVQQKECLDGLVEKLPAYASGYNDAQISARSRGKTTSYEGN